MPGRKKDAAIDPAALERILDVTRQLATPFELDAVLSQVIDAARVILHADRGTVFLYDPATDELFSKVATGTAELRFPADRGIVGEAARTRQIVNVPDCYADSRFNREIDQKTGYRTRCLLTIPLIGHDESLVGVLQVLNKDQGVFTAQDETIATALAAQCAVALQRVRMFSEIMIKQKMERELAVARDIQMRVLPKESPSVAGYDVAGWCRPADETGGDIFDIIPTNEGGVMLLLGDATGHGIGPALSVTQVRAMLRVALRLGADLGAAYANINDQLVQDLADNRFVTAFLGVLDPGAHTLTYHSGGQGPLLHFHAASGECEWLGASTVPMGFMARLPLKPPQVRRMEPGDIFALITDGVFEYEDGAAEQFAESRVGDVVRSHQTDPMASLISSIERAVSAFASGAPQKDDMTMVFVRRVPA